MVRGRAVAGLVLALAACTAAEPDADARVEGVWRGAGYGVVVDITTDEGGMELTSYEETSVSCLEGDVLPRVDGAGDEVSFGEDGEAELVLRRQGDHLVARQPGSAGAMRLERLEERPDCPSTISSDAEERRLQTFDVFWQTLTEHYPPYVHRRLDTARRTRDRATLLEDNTDEVLGRLLGRTVRGLGDMHTGVESEEESVYGKRPGTRDSADVDTDAHRRAIVARLGTRLTPVIDGKVEYAGGLPHDLGYLRITQLDDFTDGSYEEDREAFEGALDTVFRVAEEEGWRSLVLDLRLNDGGFDELALELASRLTDTSHVAFRKRARDLDADGGFTPFQEVTVSPSDRPGHDGPVAILVSDLTVSAGETAVMSMLNRSPEPTLIGRPTQGIFSDQLTRTLPGGWHLDLSNEDYRDAKGVSHEGRGLPVAREFRTPVFTDAELGGRCDSAVARAIDHLAGDPQGTTPPCPREPSG